MIPKELLASRAEADRLYQEAAFEKAALVYSDLVESNPYDSELRLRLMACASQLGQIEQAIELAKEALELGCKYPERIHYEIAKLYARLKVKEDCLNWLEKSLEARWTNRPGLVEEELFKPYRDDPRFMKLTGVLIEPEVDRDTGWQLDLDHLVEEAQRLHVSFERPAFSDEFLAMADKLRQRIPALRDEQIVVQMQRLVARLGDGHSWIYPSSTEKVSLTMLPVDFYQFSDGLFIISSLAETAQWIGGRVLKFESKPVNEVWEAMAVFISADNPLAIQRRIGPLMLKMPAFLQAAGVIDNLNSVNLTLQDRNGAIHEITLRGGPSRFTPNLRASPLSDAPAPLYLQNTERPYWLDKLDHVDAIYVQYNQIRDMAEQSLESFAAQLQAEIRATQTKNLIIDVRHNSGGNNLLNWPLVRTLVHFETDAPDHRLFVLIGRRTFSACQNFVNWLDRMAHPIFVGEPTGSKPNFIGETTNVILPYSRVQGSISSRIHFDSFWGDERQWIAPHIPIELSSEDYFANRDPVLEAALTIIG